MSSARLTRLLRSASFRLTVIYTGLFMVSAGALFATVYWTATAAMQNDMAAVLRTEALQLTEFHRRSGLAGLAQQITRRMDFRTRGPIYYLLQAPNRRVVVGNLPGMPPVDGVIDFVPEVDSGEPETEKRPRLTGYGLTLSDGSFLMVAQDANRLSDMQSAIIQAFAWSAGLTLLLAIAGGAWLGNIFLRRIDTITRASRAIMEGDLSARIPERGTHDEIEQLITNLNAMLSRIQQLMDGLRQVSSDIAHDLRTPLGRLRQHLENARDRATTTADYGQATDAAIVEADDLLDTFSALLRIAQLLAQMISNLIENALKHAPEGTTISVGLHKSGAGFEVEVADDGPGIPESERDKVFDRFYRLDRSRSTAGSGLGLALVKAIAGLHGLAIRLEDRKPGLAVVMSGTTSGPSRLRINE